MRSPSRPKQVSRPSRTRAARREEESRDHPQARRRGVEVEPRVLREDVELEVRDALYGRRSGAVQRVPTVHRRERRVHN
jgi:hypothetical protein